MNYIEAIYKLNDKLLKNEIDISTHWEEYYYLFSNLPEKTQAKDFQILDELFGWLEGYEPNQELRSKHSDYLSESQVREKVAEYQNKINQLIKKNEN